MCRRKRTPDSNAPHVTRDVSVRWRVCVVLCGACHFLLCFLCCYPCVCCCPCVATNTLRDMTSLGLLSIARYRAELLLSTHIHIHPHIFSLPLSLSFFLSLLHPCLTPHHGSSGVRPSPAVRGTVHRRVVHGILSAATATSIASRFSQCGAFVVPLARTSGSHCLCHSLFSFPLFLFLFPSFFPLFIPFGFTRVCCPHVLTPLLCLCALRVRHVDDSIEVCHYH